MSESDNESLAARPGRTEALPAALSVSQRRTTFALDNLAQVLERCDEQVLPAVYNWVGRSFGASPSQLGQLVFSRALTQALTSPVGGLAGHYFNRIHVIAVGCCIWSLGTASFSQCSSLKLGYFLWALNGLGLSLVVPNGQSLTADLYEEHERGWAFGMLFATGALGAMGGAYFATSIGDRTILGEAGWRFAFIAVAAVSLAVGAANLLLAVDPNFVGARGAARRGAGAGPGAGARGLWRLLGELRAVLTLPTFVIIIVQGIIGTSPWNALVFLTLWLQLQGFSNQAASALMALFLGGTAVGGLLGGYVGDLAAKRYPLHGRIVVCQLSILSTVPFAWLLLKALPYGAGGASVWLYAALILGLGIMQPWAAPACNNPIFSECVQEKLRNLVYAFDRSFEGALAALSAPLVGKLAEAFGFEGEATVTPGSVASNRHNAEALGNALLLCCCAPWVTCTVIYCGLHFTYPRDKAGAAEANALEAAEQAKARRLPSGDTPEAEPLLDPQQGPEGEKRLPIST